MHIATSVFCRVAQRLSEQLVAQVPEYWGGLMCNRIGAGPADKLLQYARLIGPKEALRLGLVDQVHGVATLNAMHDPPAV